MVLRLGAQAVAAPTADALVGVALTEEACPLGRSLDVTLQRDGKQIVLHLTPESRPPARRPLAELPDLGAVVRDISPPFAWEKNLTVTDGVWVESVRPGGKLGQARPALHPGDRIFSLDGKPVRNVADLRSIEPKLDGQTLVQFERARAAWVALLSVAPGGVSAGSSRRGWLGLEVQAMERPLAEKLGVPGGAALRVTEVLPGTSAERAGFKAGDVILKIDGERPEVRRQEDADVLAATLRSRRPGTEMPVKIWREGGELTLTTLVDARPIPAAEMERMEWPELELTVRAATAEDRRAAGLPPDVPAVVIAQVESAGWAELAGLAAGDIVLAINGQPVRSVAEVVKVRTDSSAGSKMDVTVQRGRYRTVLAEIETDISP